MARWWWVCLAACGPRIDPGPAAAVRAVEPVQVIERPEAGAETVSFAARIHAGSAFDPVGSEGLANLVAHALAQAPIEVAVDREWVALRLVCPGAEAIACARQFGEAIAHPVLDDSRVDAARSGAVAALAALAVDPRALGQVALEGLVYEAHPWGHAVVGRTGTLPLLDKEDAATFYTRHWVRNAVTVGIAGAYGADAVARLEERLEALPGRIPAHLAPLRPLAGSRLLLVTGDPATGVIAVGAPWPFGASTDDELALSLALSALDPKAARCGPAGPCWTLQAAVGSQEEAPAALQALLAEVTRLAGSGLTAEELSTGRDRMRETCASDAADPMARLAAAIGGPLGAPAERLTWLDAVALESVNLALKAHLHSDEISAVAVGVDPRGTAEEKPFAADRTGTIGAATVLR